MPECPKCHSNVKRGEDYCPECGESLKENGKKKYEGGFPVPEKQAENFDPEDINANRIFGVLSYFGFLVLIPILAAPRSGFVRFHANQGLILLIVGTVLQILSGVLKTVPVIGFIGSIIGALTTLIIFIWMILGIVHAVNGQSRELPIIGKYRLLK